MQPAARPGPSRPAADSSAYVILPPPIEATNKPNRRVALSSLHSYVPLGCGNPYTRVLLFV